MMLQVHQLEICCRFIKFVEHSNMKQLSFVILLLLLLLLPRDKSFVGGLILATAIKATKSLSSMEFNETTIDNYKTVSAPTMETKESNKELMLEQRLAEVF